MLKLTEMPSELQAVLEGVRGEEEDKIIRYIMKANKIFLSGAGRSGLICRMFAMRLMHMGFQAYVVGDVETPAAEDGDLLIIASGSGSTTVQIALAEKAKEFESHVLTFTYNKKGILAGICHDAYVIPAPRFGIKELGVETQQPMGNLFEQSLLLCMDHIIIRLMEEKGTTSEEMMKLHANLE